MSQNDPCASCPYRKDIPSGIWHADEYAKILAYDKETWDQPHVTFGCHKNDGTICRGWLHCHGTDALAIRIRWSPEIEDMLKKGTKVAIFSTAREAADHGLKDIRKPTRKASKFMAMIARTRGNGSSKEKRTSDQR